MPIPHVDREVILEAVSQFDAEVRGNDEFANWESNKAQQYAMEYEGRLYPPKKVLSLATGKSVGTFSGGPETNKYLNARGFEVRRLRDSTLGETFREILEQYPEARAKLGFGGDHEIRHLFQQARRLLEGWLSNAETKRPNILVVSSYGKGNWATIPWISLLDDRETRTTQDGTYVVYLFCEDGRGVYVKLAQGVTRVEKELGAQAPAILKQRADEVRLQCVGLAERGFDLTGKSDLGSTAKMAKLYEASTIASKFYARDEMPADDVLQSDLDALLSSYDVYVSGRLATTGQVAQDDRRLSLIGTWRGIVGERDAIQASIATKGGWASWWSFPIRAEAAPRLIAPFYVYAYEGDRRLTARLRVDAMATSRGQSGIETPWPEVTNATLIGASKKSDRQSEIFKTWFRIGAIELLDPPILIDNFEIAIGLSTPENLLNQNAFGYVIEEDAPLSQPSAAGSPAIIAAPPLDIDWLVSRTGLQRQFLEEMVESILGSSPQVMLAGPPGTSKTWVARQVGLFVTRNRPSLARFVQFHPSYSYESFMEGLRPVTRPGGVSFELTPGVVVELVREMQRTNAVGSPDDEYVIVIDEANRANLPRVLGELMFLFEYREQSVRLQYSGEFALPRNLRFIGTMNTADRSIRSIDIALRRRFDVFELGPDADVLGRYYGKDQGPKMDVNGLVDGFVSLNQALDKQLDRHHTIGHAFFMRPVMDVGSLRQVWKRKVFPLIEEFFFDQPDLTKEFSIERFWPSAAA